MAFPRLADPVALHTDGDLSLRVPGSPHTLSSILEEWAELGKGGQVARVEADPIDGQGLMSNIHRLTIRMADGRNFGAILKVPTTAKMEKLNPIEDARSKRSNGTGDKSVDIGWDMDKFRRLLFEMSELEANFYTMICPRVPAHLCHFLPRAFAVRRCPTSSAVEQGFLLMEDMSGKGVPANFYEGLTVGQVESAIVGLAKFHAFTSAAIPPDVLGHFRLCQYGHLEGMEEQLAERVLALPDADYFQKHRNTLRAFMHAHPSMRTDVHTRMGVRPVLSHGDFWANNLLFCKLDDAGGPGDQLCAILDWQTCHENTGLNDVLRLIFSCVNAPLRRQRMDQWLDLYFDTREEQSRKRDKDHPPEQFSRELRAKLFNEQCHFELTFTFMCLPTLFPEAKCDAHRRNLMERMEALFEEQRELYEREICPAFLVL